MPGQNSTPIRPRTGATRPSAPINNAPAPQEGEGLLKFHETMSVDGFKAKHGATKLKVLRNPSTQLLFFSCGDVTGAVSQRQDLDDIIKDPVISLVEPQEGGEQFYLLHKDGGLEAEAEL